MDILIKPILTEKMNALTEKIHRYGFITDRRANKIEIKKAVEAMYNVNVVAINTMNYSGKLKTRQTKKGRSLGRTPAIKKAIVTLALGETIDFYSNI